MHGTRLTFHVEKAFDTEAILSYLLASKTEMLVSRLLCLVKEDGKLFMIVRSKGLADSRDTLEPIACVYDDVPQLQIKLLRRKTSAAVRRLKACAELGLEEEDCNDPKNRCA